MHVSLNEIVFCEVFSFASWSWRLLGQYGAYSIEALSVNFLALFVSRRYALKDV